MATSLTEPQSGELVRASHVAPIAARLNGTIDGNNIPLAAIQYSSTTVYGMRVRNESTAATTPIFKASYNTGGSESATLDVVGPYVKGGRFYDKGGVIINARAYSADGNPFGVGANGDTDADSIALEAAIADCKTQRAAQPGGDGRYGRIHVPAGTWNLARPIDLDGLVGVRFTGDGVQATRFALATGSGSNNASYWKTKSVMSVTGSNFIRLENFSIDPNNTGASGLIPQVGLLVGQDSGNTNNANYFDTIRVAGAYIKAAHVNFASPSSVYIRCAFFRNKSTNSNDGGVYLNGGTISEAVVIFTQGNQAGVSASGSVTFINPLLGTVSMSDITMVDCEINDLCNGGSGACTCPALWLDEVYDWRSYGGNISGHGSSYVRLSGGLTGMTGTGCRNIIFDGVFFYTEGGGTTCSVVFRLTGNNTDDWAGLRNRVEKWTVADSGTHTSDIYEIMASDVTIRNCQVTVASGGGLIGGGRVDAAAPANAAETPTFIRWHVENVQIKDDNALVNQANLILFGGNDKGNFRDCSLECHGNGLSGNGSTFVRSTLRRPGTISSTTIDRGDYEIRGGGAASLAASGTVYYGEGSANATETSVVPVTVTQACLIFNLRPRVSTAPDNGGGTQTLTYTLRKATPATGFTFADTALTGTITETSVVGADTTHFVECAAGDVLLLKIVAGAGTTTNTWATWSVSVIPL